MIRNNPFVLIRADANSDIGSGHAIRCLSIAQELRNAGCEVEFVASDEESLSITKSRGFRSSVSSAGRLKWGEAEGVALGREAVREDAQSILIDSYAVTDSFFAGLRGSCNGIPVGYIDDLYTFECGRMADPVYRAVDIVFNYGFYRCEDAYSKTYAGSSTRLCIGLKFAPIRSDFAQGPFAIHEHVQRILVTTGSTNPGQMLEKMTACARRAIPDAQIDLVVGSMAEYTAPNDSMVVQHRGVQDLSALMREADIAVSAAGTTLYELCAVGLPTVAVPIVENQLPNVEGLSDRGLGCSCPMDNFEGRLTDSLKELASDESLRRERSAAMRRAVDGKGSLMIAEQLLNN